MTNKEILEYMKKSNDWKTYKMTRGGYEVERRVAEEEYKHVGDLTKNLRPNPLNGYDTLKELFMSIGEWNTLNTGKQG